MTKNKFLALFLSVAMAVSVAGCAAPDKDNNANTQTESPGNSTNDSDESAKKVISNMGDFKTVDINGKEVTKDIFKNYDLTVVNVWTTWCTYCLQEMPHLAELSEELKEQGVQMIGIVDDVKDRQTGKIDTEKLDLTKTILKRTGVKYPTLLPDKVLSEGILQSITGYPTTYFTNSDGDLLIQPISGAMEKAQWKELIEKVLKLMKENKQ